MIWHKPYNSRSRNYNEILNEITISLSTEALIFYTAVIGPWEQNVIGWAVVGLFLVTMVLNVGWMLI